MRIAIVDGQGGGIGKHITEKLRRALPDSVEIIAFGTNALATSAMIKAGANDGASGENAIVYSMPMCDIIIGTVSIISANSMFGELTPKIAEAISNSPARKVLLPINRSGIDIVGVSDEPLPHMIEKLVATIINIRSDYYV